MNMNSANKNEIKDMLGDKLGYLWKDVESSLSHSNSMSG